MLPTVQLFIVPVELIVIVPELLRVLLLPSKPEFEIVPPRLLVMVAPFQLLSVPVVLIVMAPELTSMPLLPSKPEFEMVPPRLLVMVWPLKLPRLPVALIIIVPELIIEPPLLTRPVFSKLMPWSIVIVPPSVMFPVLSVVTLISRLLVAPLSVKPWTVHPKAGFQLPLNGAAWHVL